MGWDFEHRSTKNSIVESIKRTVGENLVASKLVGKEFWVVERQGGKNAIVLFLLDEERQFGWGYKDMTEAMGPYYYSCPTEFLDLAPTQNTKWREGVARYHEVQAALDKVEVGDSLGVINSDRLYVYLKVLIVHKKRAFKKAFTCLDPRTPRRPYYIPRGVVAEICFSNPDGTLRDVVSLDGP